jgi:hypothetical protein
VVALQLIGALEALYDRLPAAMIFEEEDVIIGREVGSGSSTQVFQGTVRGQLCALKVGRPVALCIPFSDLTRV